MPKGKGKGGRGGGTKAERARQRALARELHAIKAVAECCDGFRDEWRKAKEHPGSEFIKGIPDRTDEEAVEFWKRAVMGRDGVEMLILGIELGGGAASLVALPEAIGDFACLRGLGLRGCRNLLALPDTIGKLGSLTGLDLPKCTSLVALPDSIDKLGALTELNLSGCTSLAALPAGIGELGWLRSFRLDQCSSLTALPESFSKLGALTELNLSGTSLSILPDSIGDLRALITLKLNDCVNPQFLPGTIGKLGSLTCLYLSGCSGLVGLPRTISSLPPALMRLDVSGCSSLTAVPTALSHCKRLFQFDASESGLVSLNLRHNGFLQFLRLSDCKSLIALNSELDFAHRLEIVGADDVPRFNNGARIWHRLEMRRCEGCGRQRDVDAPRLRVCGRCGVTPYCGVECQRAHWERHRPRCSLHRKERRRLCVLCGRMAADSDPPFPTCYCGERRYCGEACQVRDWFDGTARSRPHSETCASGYLYLDG